MATAAKPRPKAGKNGQKHVLELAVAFGNVNVGDETARVGVSISRANMTPTQADRTLCGKRLRGTILARTFGAQAEQASLPGVEDDAELSGVFDVNGFSVSPKRISTGLTFLLSAIDVRELARFAKREGMLTVNDVEDLPDEAESGEE